ncbi:hypothetical protein ABW20_dc0105581 [Dactylellina cionopaga]|nr:hypothetical protein ABW20_dc0105581 [Dactylellina cionopaga]
MLQHQETSDKSIWYYNFLSASGRLHPNAWSNGSGSEWGMNRRMVNYWAQNTYYTTGVIWMDFFREPVKMDALARIMAAMNAVEIRSKVRS